MAKIIKGISNVPVETLFEIDTQSSNRGRRLKLVKTLSATNALLYSFSHSVVNRWNSLSKETVNDGTITSFKSHLQTIHQTKIDFFMDN